MVDNEHWGTIKNPRNLALKVEGVRKPVVQPATLHHQEVTHQMSKYFSWGLTLHFSWLGKDHDHISCCMQLAYFCLLCSSPGVLMLSQSRRYTRFKEKNLLVVVVLNYVLCTCTPWPRCSRCVGWRPRPLTRRRTRGCPSPAPTPNTRRSCVLFVLDLEIKMKNVESLICH